VFTLRRSASIRPISTAGIVRKFGYTFSVLSDAKAEVIRRYDLLHREAGPKGNDISRPAEFFVDSTGTVQWVNLTDNIAVRTRPEQVVRAIDALRGGSRD
jgi:peroxiredoxin